jgi:2-methylisocitrate lyase-like PEP mutase family enzyme
VHAVCGATEKPFNFMVGIKGKSFTVAALAAAGVKRISLATSLYRAAMTGLLNAAKEVRERGTFGYIDTSLANSRNERVPPRVGRIAAVGKASHHGRDGPAVYRGGSMSEFG